MFSTGFSSFGFLLLFPGSITFFIFFCFWSVSSNIDEVLSINSSANMFVFGDFIIHHKDWLTYLGGTDRPGELCYNFFGSQMTLLRWLTFLFWSLTVTLTVLHFWISFFLLVLVFVLQWLSFHCEILIMLNRKTKTCELLSLKYIRNTKFFVIEPQH